MIETMKNLSNASKNVTIAALLKFQVFEKLNRTELIKVKGGSRADDPPVVIPD